MRRGLPSYRQDAEQNLPPQDTIRCVTIPGIRQASRPPRRCADPQHEVPAPFNTVQNGIQSLILSVPYAVFQSEKFVRTGVHELLAGSFSARFSVSYCRCLRWPIPRRIRYRTRVGTLVWLMTRPIPRPGIYLAKYFGTLPWAVLFGIGGFAALCLAGGEYGARHRAVLAGGGDRDGDLFTPLFHLIGAIFRRPVVVGLVYVFFFEAVVGSLPGSLKLLV